MVIGQEELLPARGGDTNDSLRSTQRPGGISRGSGIALDWTRFMLCMVWDDAIAFSVPKGLNLLEYSYPTSMDLLRVHHQRSRVHLLILHLWFGSW